MPPYRIETRGFHDSESDIRAVCDSAGNALWRHFPGHRVEPFVLVRGHNGPIILHERNERAEVVIRLDTGGRHWSQYAYQFAHEFCHLLCGFDDEAKANLWFEETLCETASLFALRKMARSWNVDPPFRNWRSYSASHRRYADEVIAKRKLVDDIEHHGMAEFYRTHRRALAEEPCNRELNGAMAVVLLKHFEKRPERWEAVRWLNSARSPDGETFEQYLGKWRDSVPPRHKPFVRTVAELYGIDDCRILGRPAAVAK